MQAIRFGDWKAVRASLSKPLELYDLKSDPGEAKDLAAANPEIIARAESLMKAAHTDDPNWPWKDKAAKPAKPGKKAKKAKAK